MSIPIEPLSILTEPVSKLIEWLKERAKRNEIKEQVNEYLEDNFQEYTQCINKFGESGEELVSFLDSIEIGPSRTQLQQFVKISGDIVYSYSQLVMSFIDLARSCKILTGNPAFMQDLQESKQRFIYDFLIHMAGIVKSDELIIIDESFFGFLKLYRREWTKGVKISSDETKKIADEAKKYIRKITTVIVPSLRHIRMRDRASRIFVKQIRYPPNMPAEVKVTPTNLSLVEYMPKELRPIFEVINEVNKTKY